MNFFTKYYNSHPFARVTSILTFFLLLFMVLMNFYFPNTAVNGFESFILAFEFAETIQDIHLLFQNLSAGEIKNIDFGNYLDFGFMVAYCILLAFIFKTAAKEFNKRWLLVGVLFSAIILFADIFENLILLEITNLYTSEIIEQDLILLLVWLHQITWIKWGGLAITFFLFYTVTYKLKWWYKSFGVIFILPFASIFIAGNFTPKELTLFTNFIFLSFFALIMFALIYKKRQSEN